MELIWEDKKYI